MKAKFLSILAARTLCAGSILFCVQAAAADIQALVPNATRDSISEAVTNFERSTGHKVIVRWTGTEAITKRVAEGEVVDIVINASQNIDRLTAEGKLSPGTRTDFARSAIGVAIAPKLPRPDVSTVAGLKAALLAAKTIVISSGTSGRYLVELINRLGVSEEVKGKIKQPPSGAQIGELLASGEADLGFQQVSELIHVSGIQYLGPLPAEFQQHTIYAGAAHNQAVKPDVARAFLKVLRQPETAAAVQKSGMEPL